jgi:hypothetical protein
MLDFYQEGIIKYNAGRPGIGLARGPENTSVNPERAIKKIYYW